jgi:hypothetical protein
MPLDLYQILQLHLAFGNDLHLLKMVVRDSLEG